MNKEPLKPFNELHLNLEDCFKVHALYGCDGRHPIPYIYKKVYWAKNFKTISLEVGTKNFVDVVSFYANSGQLVEAIRVRKGEGPIEHLELRHKGSLAEQLAEIGYRQRLK